MSDEHHTEPGFRGAVRELLEVARVASLLAEGHTTGPLGNRVSGSKAGSAHLTFSRDLPVSERLERTIRRVADVYRAEVEGTGAESVRAQAKTGTARQAKTRAVLGEVGMDATAVAFIHGMTTEGVKKLRGRHDRDPDTGVRAGQLRAERVDGKPTHSAPLTARPAGGEVGQ